jgi:hypothetical protein
VLPRLSVSRAQDSRESRDGPRQERLECASGVRNGATTLYSISESESARWRDPGRQLSDLRDEVRRLLDGDRSG